MLTATGLFGVIAYAVSERTREIGICMALGAGPREVFRLVVGRGMLLASIGFLVGFRSPWGLAAWWLAYFTEFRRMTLLPFLELASCLPASRLRRVIYPRGAPLAWIRWSL